MAIKGEYIPLGTPQGHAHRPQPSPAGRRKRERRRTCIGALIVLCLILAIPLLLTVGDRLFRPNEQTKVAAVNYFRGAATIRRINSDSVLMIKTGHSVLYERIPMHLIEPRPDIPNKLVYSDVPLRIADVPIIDALANFSRTHSGLEEFSEYRRLQTAKANGVTVAATTSGWPLDRFKFAPMTTHAYKMFPNATWYIAIDGDSFLFYSTLLRWLDRYFDAPESTPWYLGYDEVGDPDKPRYFAHGGAGFAMSQGLLRGIHTGDPDGSKFINDKRFDFIRCGDCALGDYIADLPGRNGHLDAGIDLFHHDGLDKVIFRPRLWHAFVVSLHHNSAAQLNTLRQWEKRFLPTIPEWDGVRQCDLLFGLTPAFLREPLLEYVHALKTNGTAAAAGLRKLVVAKDWKAEEVDSFECGSECMQKYGGEINEEGCDRACDAHPSCFGWQLSGESCTLARDGFRIGEPVNEHFNLRTAWRLDRIAALEKHMPCADSWFRQHADEEGFGLQAGRADFQNTGLDAKWVLPVRPNVTGTGTEGGVEALTWRNRTTPWLHHQGSTYTSIP